MTSKRIFDIVFSLTALLVLWPLLALIALGIRLTSAGPVIFRQRRTGLMQKEFVIYKFRTMYHGTGRPGVDLISSSDARITSVGTFLRKTRMDELPQFFNVLKGEMTVVGPRPYELEGTRLLLELEPKAALRFTVLPGMTGLAQVMGRKGKTLRAMAEDSVIYDLEYINHRSFWLDLEILLKTIVVVCQGRGI